MAGTTARAYIQLSAVTATENPYFEVNPPLRSRSTLFRLEPLDGDALDELLRRGRPA